MYRLVTLILLTVCFTVSAQSKIEKKLKLIVPAIKINDVTVKDALQIIRKKSKEIDPDKTGINILIQEKNQKLLSKKVTFNLTNIPLEATIKYVCQSSGLHYKVNDSGTAVIVSSQLANQLITKFYTVTSSFKGYVNSKNTNNITQEKMKDFFKTGGVSFPAGSQLSYIASRNLVTITNTSINQGKAKKLLQGLGCLR